MTSKNMVLNTIYTDPKDSGSFGGVERLLKSARNVHKRMDIKRKDVEKFLQQQETYTLHKQIRRRFIRNQTIVKGIDVQWQADLAEVIPLASSNDGYRYLLTVIDCFSKFAWVVPVKKKDSEHIFEAFNELLKKSFPRKPERIQTDKGKEFINSTVQKFFTDNQIEHFMTNNETKASIVERFNRTLKTRMFTYFTENNTQRFIDVLEQIVSSYNNSQHRSIGIAPSQVKKKDIEKIWHRLYGKMAQQPIPLQRKHVPKLDSTVRIAKSKAVFAKGYIPNWTEELFYVKGVKRRQPKALYKLTDYMNERIEGTFYPEEIQKVKDKGSYEVEKVLKRRTLKNGQHQSFVKWKGWPEKFNTWIDDQNFD